MNDDLMTRTETRRTRALATLTAVEQTRLGQFFTPERAAVLIAGLPRLPRAGRLRVLDPGAGVGSLAAALVHRVGAEAPAVHVEIVAVEVDSSVSSYLSQTMADCEESAAAKGGSVRTTVVTGDFLELSSGAFESAAALADPFDLVIMNPPYAKLAANSAHRRALLRQGMDCPNLYAAFLALGAAALTPGGQLVAITPRSFANGPYFERFRKYLLRTIAIDRLHTFESRSTVFADTGVLQENIVLSGTRDGERDRVRLSVSQGHTDTAAEYLLDYDNLVRPGDPHKFLRIAAVGADVDVMSAMPASLPELGVAVSTGRVVDFRARENLREDADEGCVPLIYPGNIRGGIVEWPRQMRKPQGFAVLDDSDRRLLVPSGCYVVVKRFSAKEERRRIVAGVWDPVSNGDTDVAFENHLNVFHSRGAGLSRPLAVGLSLWLNSSAVDQFFRTFSGHTQVNATDLRSLRYPSVEALRALGEGRSATLPHQGEIDALIDRFITGTGEAA
ncbi:Eco57I restriction-modification methylase domain-containing protein [soil metagenome]